MRMHDEVGCQRAAADVFDHGDAPTTHPSINLAVPQCDNSGCFEIDLEESAWRIWATYRLHRLQAIYGVHTPDYQIIGIIWST